jgi:uncharacterized membrane protein
MRAPLHYRQPRERRPPGQTSRRLEAGVANGKVDMFMSAGEFAPTRINPRTWLIALALVSAFVIGSTAGSVVSLVLSGPAGEQAVMQPGPAPAICASTAFVNYDRLLGNMAAAADRHDIRAWVGYRNKLATLISQAGLVDSVKLARATEQGCTT